MAFPFLSGLVFLNFAATKQESDGFPVQSPFEYFRLQPCGWWWKGPLVDIERRGNQPDALNR
jgi:hypothetical protein